MKEFVTLWVNTLARATSAVVQYSSELCNVISGHYINIDFVSSPDELNTLDGD